MSFWARTLQQSTSNSAGTALPTGINSGSSPRQQEQEPSSPKPDLAPPPTSPSRWNHSPVPAGRPHPLLSPKKPQATPPVSPMPNVFNPALSKNKAESPKQQSDTIEEKPIVIPELPLHDYDNDSSGPSLTSAQGDGWDNDQVLEEELSVGPDVPKEEDTPVEQATHDESHDFSEDDSLVKDETMARENEIDSSLDETGYYSVEWTQSLEEEETAAREASETQLTGEAATTGEPADQHTDLAHDSDFHEADNEYEVDYEDGSLSPLPPGWERLTDPSTGDPYFFNQAENVTTWEKPVASVEHDKGSLEDQTDTNHDLTNEDQNLLAEHVAEGNDWNEFEESDEEASIEADKDNDGDDDEEPVNMSKEMATTLGVVGDDDNGSEDSATESDENFDQGGRGDAEETNEVSVEKSQSSSEAGIERPTEESAVATETTSMPIPSLPPGWAQLVDPSSGDIYYLNETENVTSWDRPMVDEQDDVKEEMIPLNADDDQISSEEHLAVDGMTGNTDGSEDGWDDFEDPSENVEGDYAEHTEETNLMETASSENEALPPLPAGWEQMIDPSSGDPYYLNEAENITTWDRPTVVNDTNAVEVPIPTDTIKDDGISAPAETEVGPAHDSDAWDWDDVEESSETAGEDAECTGGTNVIETTLAETKDLHSGDVYYLDETENTTTWDMPMVGKDDGIVEELNRPDTKDHISHEKSSTTGGLAEDAGEDGDWEDFEEPSESGGKGEDVERTQDSDLVKTISSEDEVPSPESQGASPVEEAEIVDKGRSSNKPFPEDYLESAEGDETVVVTSNETPIESDLLLYPRSVQKDDPSSGVQHSHAKSKEADGCELHGVVEASGDPIVGEEASYDEKVTHEADEGKWSDFEEPGEDTEETVGAAALVEDTTSDEILNDTATWVSATVTDGASPAAEKKMHAAGAMDEPVTKDQDPGRVSTYEDTDLTRQKDLLVSDKQRTVGKIKGDSSVGESPLEAIEGESVASGGVNEEGKDDVDDGGGEPLVEPLPQLPPGWVRLADPSSGIPYYYNEVENTTSLEIPAVADQYAELDNGEDRGPVVADEIERETEEGEWSGFEDAYEEPVETVDEVNEEVSNDIEGLPIVKERGNERPHETSEGGWSDFEDAGEGSQAEEASNDEKTADSVEATQSPASGDQMPPGWVKLIDPSTGNPYYYNEIKNLTSWELPVAVEDTETAQVGEGTEAAPLSGEGKSGAVEQEDFGGGKASDTIDAVHVSAADGGPQPGLPQGWVQLIDPSSGAPYYYHQADNLTTWDRPGSAGDADVVGGDDASPTEKDHAVTSVQGLGNDSEEQDTCTPASNASVGDSEKPKDENDSVIECFSGEAKAVDIGADTDVGEAQKRIDGAEERPIAEEDLGGDSKTDSNGEGSWSDFEEFDVASVEAEHKETDSHAQSARAPDENAPQMPTGWKELTDKSVVGKENVFDQVPHASTENESKSDAELIDQTLGGSDDDGWSDFEELDEDIPTDGLDAEDEDAATSCELTSVEAKSGGGGITKSQDPVPSTLEEATVSSRELLPLTIEEIEKDAAARAAWPDSPYSETFSPRFQFLSSVPEELEKLQEQSARRRHEFHTQIHDLECRLASITSRLAHATMDRDLVCKDWIDKTVMRPLEEVADRLFLEAEKQLSARPPPATQSSSAPCLADLERRMVQVHTYMIRHMHVTMHDARSQFLEELSPVIEQDLTPCVKLEHSKAAKREGTIVRRFESIAGNMSRQIHEAQADRRVALEMMQQRLSEIVESDDEESGEEFLQVLQDLRRQLHHERNERKKQDRLLREKSIKITAAMKRALTTSRHW